jgi:hypothetical protein
MGAGRRLAGQLSCVDLFDFDEQGLIETMTIVYDTAPIREAVGDKYRACKPLD